MEKVRRKGLMKWMVYEIVVEHSTSRGFRVTTRNDIY